MRSKELQIEYVRLRASGESYNSIAEKLHISKSTCSRWEKSLGEDIAEVKQSVLDSLYETYSMKKEARIKELGTTLNQIDEALVKLDLTDIKPEKLLELKLKYMEALQREYVTTDPAFKFKDSIQATDIVNALGDLLDRVRAGEVTTEQANRESLVLSNLLKAYNTVEVKGKLDEIEAVMDARENS